MLPPEAPVTVVVDPTARNGVTKFCARSEGTAPLGVAPDTESATALRTFAAAGEPAKPSAADAPAEEADAHPPVQQIDIA